MRGVPEKALDLQKSSAKCSPLEPSLSETEKGCSLLFQPVFSAVDPSSSLSSEN